MCLFASSLSLIVLIPLKESNSADLCFVLLCIYAVCRWPQDEGVHVPIYQVKGAVGDWPAEPAVCIVQVRFYLCRYQVHNNKFMESRYKVHTIPHNQISSAGHD